MNHPFKYPKNFHEVAANLWEEISREHYIQMLECLPPARRSNKAFAVGEPLNHMTNGKVVHTVCIGPVEDGKFYSKPYPLDEFDPKNFREQIFNQQHVGKFARSVESNWLGKIVGVAHDHNGDLMFVMKGVNTLVMAGAGISEPVIDDDDTQWFSPADVEFVNKA